MDINEFQALVKVMYKKEHFVSDDPLMLALAVAEETGELAKAVNVHHCPSYKLTKTAYSTVEHEMIDLLVYIAALANCLDIKLDSLLNDKANEICKKYDLVVL